MKVMCIAQTQAVEKYTGSKHSSTPKFGDVLTVARKVYDYETKQDYYFFCEFGFWPGGAMFQAKFFTPIKEDEDKTKEASNEY